MFNYKTCGKQYTVKTTDLLKSRLNNNKSEARKAESGDRKC